VVGTLTRRSASKKMMRRLSLLVVVLALVASGCFGGSASESIGGESSVEKTVTAYLMTTSGPGTKSTSCAEDHTLKVQGTTATVYRCIPHGGEQDGIEVCVAFHNGRMLGAKQRSTVPMTELLCRGQA
jgi:hypothetical protein